MNNFNDNIDIESFQEADYAVIAVIQQVMFQDIVQAVENLQTTQSIISQIIEHVVIYTMNLQIK